MAQWDWDYANPASDGGLFALPRRATSDIAELERDVLKLTMDPDRADRPEGRELLRQLVDVVSRLTRPEREARVERLIARAHRRLDSALQFAETDGGLRSVTGIVTMFSGGNDSSVLAHLFRERATHVGMANTGIGIEQTRDYVRTWARAWGLPVIEKSPPEGETYEDLVLGRYRARTGPSMGNLVYDGGFPGPGAHSIIFRSLKGRAFDQIRRELVNNGNKERVIFVAGRRANESARRNGLTFRNPIHREDSVVWCDALIDWTSLDLNTYRLMQGDVPVNEVSQLIHMSGECLCGCFAEENELNMIGDFYPESKRYIESLEAKVRDACPPGVALNQRSATWGWGWAKRKPLGCECRVA